MGESQTHQGHVGGGGFWVGWEEATDTEKGEKQAITLGIPHKKYEYP